MQNPPRACSSLSWLHRRPTVGEDGVYCEAVSPFPHLSLLFTEPFCRACVCLLFYAVLLAFLLLVYTGDPAGPCLLFLHTTPPFRLFLSPLLNAVYALFSKYAQVRPEVAPAGLPRAKGHVESRGAYTEKSTVPLRSLIRELLRSYAPTFAPGPCSFFELNEFIAASVLLFFVFRSLRRVASGFSRASLEAYSRRLVSTSTFSHQGASYSSALPTRSTSQHKAVTQENAAVPQQKVGGAAGTEHLLAGQVAVVTGATSGIGKETALQLAKWGARVYIGARNAEQGRLVAATLNAEVAAVEGASEGSSVPHSPVKAVKQALLHLVSFLRSTLVRDVYCSPKTANMRTPSHTQGRSTSSSCAASRESRVHAHELDLCRADSVREFACWVLAETHGQVDILVNNAGQMYIPELIRVPFDEGACFEGHNVCNHMGHFLLTQLLLPALKHAAASASASGSGKDAACLAAAVGAGRGRIINIASCAHVYHSPDFSVLDAACTPETAAAAAAAIASDEAATQQQELMQQQPRKETRTAETLLEGRRQLTAKSYRPWGAYADSKLCNIWFTKEVQRRLLASDAASAPKDIRRTEARSCEVPASTNNGGGRSSPHEQGGNSCVGVYAVHPGVVSTNLGRHFLGRNFILKCLGVLAAVFVFKKAADGAATALFLCIAPKYMLHWGGYYADGSPGWVVPAALERKGQRELWVVSESLCRRSVAAARADVHTG